MPAKRYRLRGGLSAKFKWGQTKTGKWRVQSIGDAKSPRGPMPLSFLPFEVMDLCMNRNIEFDDEYELQRCLEGLAA